MTPLVMSPLADPVIAAIFSSVEASGEAAESLIRAVLEQDENSLKGNIISVIPQRVYSIPGVRGTRIDVHIHTDQGEYVIVEVQINPDRYIAYRNFFSAAHIAIETSRIGDKVPDMAGRIPRIICINILAYNARTTNTDLLQPYKIKYTKAPDQVVMPEFTGYDIQLPSVEHLPHDFDNALYAWCYILYTAHKQQKTLEEVIAMTPQAQQFAKTNSGYTQFCQRYKLAAGDTETRREYVAWMGELMRHEGELKYAEEVGINKGVVKGRQLEAIDTAKKALLEGFSVEQVFKIIDLPISTIESLRESLGL